LKQYIADDLDSNDEQHAADTANSLDKLKKLSRPYLVYVSAGIENVHTLYESPYEFHTGRI